MAKEPQTKNKSLPATTTQQEDLVVAGQRAINKIWEVTQACIAILVTMAFLYCEVLKIDSEAIKMAFALVIGFYFSRTNHTQIGGRGNKATDTQKYVGR